MIDREVKIRAALAWALQETKGATLANLPSPGALDYQNGILVHNNGEGRSICVTGGRVLRIVSDYSAGYTETFEICLPREFWPETPMARAR